jgi:hypothetical protein
MEEQVCIPDKDTFCFWHKGLDFIRSVLTLVTFLGLLQWQRQQCTRKYRLHELCDNSAIQSYMRHFCRVRV